VHDELQVLFPGVLHAVVQSTVLFWTQWKDSSVEPLLLSSQALHTSAPAQVPQPLQLLLQVCDPGVEQDVVQDREVALQQAKPLSQPATQSSSRPLQLSAGGTHESHSHRSLHRFVPWLLHEVGHVFVLPGAQSQSLLAHAAQVQSARHWRVPAQVRCAVQGSTCSGVVHCQAGLRHSPQRQSPWHASCPAHEP